VRFCSPSLPSLPSIVTDYLSVSSFAPTVRVTKLKKRMAELEEDVFGLNIALDVRLRPAFSLFSPPSLD
jgi:hypothetical protein